MNNELDQDGGGSEAAGLVAAIPSIIWERKWFVAIPAILGLLIGIVATFVIKPTYQAKATMLVESQDVPGQGQVVDDEAIDRRMAKIREQILSRPDLVELIQTYNLYDAASHRETLSTLADRVRDNTSLDAVSAGAGRNQTSIAFSLTYANPKPDLAQAVAQSFVDRLLKLDAASRVSEAQNTVNVLENQQQTLQTQLSGFEGELAQLTGSNGAALSNGSGMIITGGGNYETQISQLQQRNADLRLQMGTSAIERSPAVIAAEAQLAAAREQYSDNHPDVLLAKQRVEAARKAATSVQQTGVSAVVQQQIAENNALIAQMTSAMNAERARTAEVAAAASRGPAIQQKVSQLQAQAAQVRDNLGRVTSSLLTARSVAQAAAEQRGERLTLIDPPVTPEKPTSPNRPLLVLGGLAGGLAVGLLLAFALELLLRPIRGVGMLTSIVGVPPLSVVPVLKHSKH